MRTLPEPDQLCPEPSAAPPLSVWATAQDGPRAQRRGRYLPESDAHPAKMFPAIAAHAVTAYTRPGDLVVDPMCGIGTTLVEAMHLGRMAVGVEYEKRWADLAARNIEYAGDRGAPRFATVVRGDARDIERLLGSDVHGKASLVLTSPPYGPATHGQVRITRDSGQAGVQKWNHAYGDDPGNLARRSVQELMDGFTEILRGCRRLLKPGGFLVITARPFRRRGRLVDIPGMATNAALDAGFTLHERCVALLAAARDGGLKARTSFFQLVNSRHAFAAGSPTHVCAHEEVLVARWGGGSQLEPANSPADGADGAAEDVGCGCVPLTCGTGTRRSMSTAHSFDAPVCDEVDVTASCRLRQGQRCPGWLDLQPDPAGRVWKPFGIAVTADRGWTLETISGLPPMLRLQEAAGLLGIGRTSAYNLARRGAFPAPVLRIGRQYRVPAAGLLQLLDAAVPRPGGGSPEPVDFRPGSVEPGCVTAWSRASITRTC